MKNTHDEQDVRVSTNNKNSIAKECGSMQLTEPVTTQVQAETVLQCSFCGCKLHGNTSWYTHFCVLENFEDKTNELDDYKWYGQYVFCKHCGLTVSRSAFLAHRSSCYLKNRILHAKSNLQCEGTGVSARKRAQLDQVDFDAFGIDEEDRESDVFVVNKGKRTKSFAELGRDSFICYLCGLEFEKNEMLLKHLDVCKKVCVC